MSFAIHGSVPLQTVHHGVALNVYIYTPLGGPCDHKGDDLRDRRGKPDTGQLQHWRQDQEHQQRAARDHRQVEGQLVAGRLGVGRGGISLPREIDCEDVEKAV